MTTPFHNLRKKIVLCISGMAGCGKSTVAKKIAEEAKNRNVIAKMEDELAMYKGMEESRQELEDISVNTVAPPVRTIKQGPVNGGFVN